MFVLFIKPLFVLILGVCDVLNTRDFSKSGFISHCAGQGHFLTSRGPNIGYFYPIHPIPLSESTMPTYHISASIIMAHNDGVAHETARFE